MHDILHCSVFGTQEFSSNLKSIVSMMREAWPSTEIILITPPPIDKEAWDAFKGQDGERSLESAQKYAQECKSVAEASECHCIDLMSEFFKVCLAHCSRYVPSQIVRWGLSPGDG